MSVKSARVEEHPNVCTSEDAVNASTRVLLVAHWDWVLFKFRLPLARALREAGCDVRLVCPAGKHTSALAEAGFTCIPWPLKRASLNPLAEARSIAALTRIYRRERPALAHHFTIKTNLYGSIAARIARVPRVINTFSGLGFFFSDRGQAKLLRLLLLPLLRLAFRSPNTWTIAQNSSDYALLARQRLLHESRGALIAGSGVDTRTFTPLTYGDGTPRNRSPLIVMASRLLWDKGVGTLVEAAHMLRSRGVRADFVIAGERDPGNPGSVSAEQLQRWMSEAQVRFVGYCADMPQLLRQAHIAVLPTTYPEGVPLFLLEAAACGLPLIATDVPGCRDIVRHGVNGLLVAPGSGDDLAGAIQRLASDESLRQTFGRASRAIAVQSFSEEKTIGEYFQLYRAVGLLH
jgi:glycosyltransferase involved in cell wall biosynthesis